MTPSRPYTLMSERVPEIRIPIEVLLYIPGGIVGPMPAKAIPTPNGPRVLYKTFEYEYSEIAAWRYVTHEPTPRP